MISNELNQKGFVMRKVIIWGGVTAATTVLMLGVGVTALIAASFLMEGSRGERIEIRNGELYYKDTVTSEEARKLADFLDEQFGSFENQKTFQVDRCDGAVRVRMCAQPKTWETDELDYSYVAIEALLQLDVFPNENVKIELCDRYLNVKKEIDKFPVKTEKEQDG